MLQAALEVALLPLRQKSADKGNLHADGGWVRTSKTIAKASTVPAVGGGVDGGDLFTAAANALSTRFAAAD
jgi:hypothetical protein